MRKNISIILLTLTAFISSGQTFLSKYPKLTKNNLSDFFSDWRAYSDSVNTNNAITDSVLEEIVMWNNTTIDSESNPNRTHRYNVIPQTIEVERYYLDVDTVMSKFYFGFPNYIPDLKDDQYVKDSITQALPCRGLYLTPEINKMLSSFAGGLRSGDTIGEINEENVRVLKEYIPVDYGHWGGYWWFTSFPLITHIEYADNLIAVMRRTSWWTGDVIWYVKEDGKFIRRPEPVSSWCE